MRALIFVHIMKEVAHIYLQNAPLFKNWAWSCVQAAVRDLLVSYSVIDIGDYSKSMNTNYLETTFLKWMGYTLYYRE